MGAFEQFPYSNFHDLNLDWILQIVKATGKTIEELPETVQDAVKKGLEEANLEQLVLDALTKYGVVINVKAPPNGLTPATGDGSADDTEAVQGCINYAANNKGVVFFPSGSYLVSNLTIKDGVTLAGASRYGSRLVLRGSSVDPWFGGAFTGCGFYNLTFDGNADIQINNVSIFRANVKDCQFSNLILADGQYLLDLTGQGGHIQIDNVVFNSAVVMGMRIAGTSLVTADGLFFGGVSTLAGDCAFEVTSNGGTYTGIVSTVTAPDLFINTGNNNVFQISNAVTTNYQDTGEGTQVNISGDIAQYRIPTFDISATKHFKFMSPTALAISKFFDTVNFETGGGTSYNVLVANENTPKLAAGHTYNTMDSLIAADNVADGDIVNVATGNSFWKISKTGTETPLCKKLSNGLYATYIKTGGYINIVGLGVKSGDNCTDVVQWLLDNKETLIYFPAGTYLLNVNISRRCSIIGDMGTEEIYDSGYKDFEGNTIFKPADPEKAVLTFLCNRNTACESYLENIHITCDDTTPQGILAKPDDDTVGVYKQFDFNIFKNVYIIGGDVGIEIRGRCIYNIFDNVRCDNQTSYGFWIKGSTQQVNANLFRNVTVGRSTNFGFYMDAPTNSWCNTFINCVFEQCGREDCTIIGENNLLLGCYFEMGSTVKDNPGLIISGHSTLIGCNFAMYKYCMYLQGNHHFSVIGCQDYETSGSVIRYAQGPTELIGNNFSIPVNLSLIHI